jgi:5-methylthioadenosine/S-adenosylhomocysteine deaminase
VTFILADACVVTVNSANDIIERGSILVVDDRIAAIGSLAQVKSEAPGADIIDCAGNILIPGMVNTHTHLFQILLKGPGDDMC